MTVELPTQEEIEAAKNQKYLFVLYDGRVRNGDYDTATVFCTADDEEECREEAHEYGDDAVWVQWECKGDDLINPALRLDLSPDPSRREKRRKRQKR